MKEQEIKEWKEKIDRMTPEERAALFLRGSRSPIFANEELTEYFLKQEMRIG